MTLEEIINKKHLSQTKIRPCHIYNEEFLECSSIKGRFHQYFIHNEFLDCSQLKTDFNNCNLWEDTKDIKAYKELVQSEQTRKFKRLKAHYENDVWKKRDKPPENWNAPLPEWLENKNKNTYLARKAEDIKNGTVDDTDLYVSNACSIL